MTTIASNVPAGLIFDLDGTVADTLPLCISAFQSTFRALGGRELDDAQVRALFGPTEEGILRAVLGEPVAPAMTYFLAEYERRHDECGGPFAGLVDLLRQIAARGTRVGMVTGKGAATTAVTLRRLGLTDLFDPIETGSAEQPIKPACLTRVLRAWQLAPADVGYLGDQPYDITAAHQAGVRALAAGWASSFEAEAVRTARPERVFRTVAELAAWMGAG